MNNEKWVDCLLDLQKIDIELGTILSAIKKNPLRKQLLDEQLLDAKRNFAMKTEDKHQVDKEIKELQHQVQKKEEVILNIKMKMGLIKDNESYRKVLLEIEHGESAISDLETQELQLLETVDEKQGFIDEVKTILDQQQELVDEQRGEFDEQLKKLEAQKIEKEKEYNKLESLVDDDIYQKYKTIRESLGGRKGAILVELDEDRCGGCFIKLTVQKIINAKKRIPKTLCNNCGVLIYQ